MPDDQTPDIIEAKAGELYAAYCAAVGGKAFNGDQLPAWDEFRKDESKTLQANAWRSAALVSSAWDSVEEIPIESLIRPYLFIVGRTFSSGTYQVTGTDRQSYVFLRERDGRMVYRFKDVAEFMAKQDCILKGARSVRFNFGVDIVDGDGKATEVVAEPEPALEPVSLPAPSEPDPVAVWKERRDKRRAQLNLMPIPRLQELAEDLSIGKFSPRADLVEARLIHEFGTEPGAVIPAVEEEVKAPEVDTTAIVAPVSSDDTPTDVAKLSKKDVWQMPLEKLHALGAKHGFTGSRKEICNALVAKLGL